MAIDETEGVVHQQRTNGLRIPIVHGICCFFTIFFRGQLKDLTGV